MSCISSSDESRILLHSHSSLVWLYDSSLSAYADSRYYTVQEHILVQHNKQYHIKVLFNSFHLNGHTLGFHDHPQT